MHLKKLSAHKISKKIVLISLIYFFLHAMDRCSPRSGRGTIVIRHHISW